jgi:hypothetical protein
MAYNKNVPAKTTTDGAETLPEEVKVVVSTNVEAPKRRKIDKDEEVSCRSVVSGELIYTSRRTLMTVEWDEYGSIQYLTVEELMTMKSSQKSFLTRPWIIVEDDEIVDYLGLRSIYDNIIPLEDLEGFLLNTDLAELTSELQKAPRGIKDLLADKAREMIVNETLHDTRVIKILNTQLNIDLSLVQE